MKKAAINLINVIGGEVLLKVANLGAVMVIARLYGASTLGLYATALAVTTVATMFADNGLRTSAITQIAGQPRESDALVSQLHFTKTLLVLAMVATLAAFGFWSGFSPAIWVVGALVTLRTVLQSYCQLQLAILKSIDRMNVIGAIQASHSLVLLAGIAVVHRFSLPFELLLGWLIAGQMLEFILLTRVLWRAGMRPARFSISRCWKLVKRSAPVGVTEALGNLVIRLDIIVLSALVSLAEVGQFSAAQMIFIMTYVVSWLFGSVMLPELVRRAASLAELEQYVQKWSRLFFLGLAPLALSAFFIAPRVVQLLYGRAFAQAGSLASIMLLAVPFLFLNALYLNRAIAIGCAAVYLGASVAITLLALGLDYSLGRSFGPSGVAAAIVIREVALFTGFRVTATRTADQIAQEPVDR